VRVNVPEEAAAVILIDSEFIQDSIVLAIAVDVLRPDMPIVVPVVEVELVSKVKVVALPSASIILNVSPLFGALDTLILEVA
jgi:hypothetical protein